MNRSCFCASSSHDATCHLYVAPRLPALAPAGTVRVRIAVATAIDASGKVKVAAAKDCCYSRVADSEEWSAWCARNGVDDQSAPIVWIEADVPVPLPVVVEGRVAS